jgi:hypothetical protein
MLHLWVVALALATVATIFTLPTAWWLRAIGTASGAGWAWHEARHRQRRQAPRRLRVDGDRTITIVTADGLSMRGRILPSSYVGARMTTIVWRPAGRRLVRAEILLPDMLPPDDFRRLRVLLRYGRSEPTQGAPPSHA